MELYLHIRVVFGLVIGLAFAQLLNGVAQIVQHPKRYKIYWVHTLWVMFLFLYLLAYWWWKFNLAAVQVWTFGMYAFIAIYAVILYLLCAMILPSDIDEYEGYRVYYYSRGQWFLH